MKIFSNKHFIEYAAVRPKIAFLIADRGVNHLGTHVDMGAHVIACSALLGIEKIYNIIHIYSLVYIDIPKSLSIVIWLLFGN